MLGKRKRDAQVVRRQTRPASDRDGSQEDPENSKEILRQYFESHFKPLPELQSTTTPLVESEDAHVQSSDESSWEGLSDSDHGSAPVAAIEVVKHDTISNAETGTEAQRGLYKSFISPKPPRDVISNHGKREAKLLEDDDASEAVNLKHDLDLQRLLKESHLLEQAKASSSLGSHRHKAVDMRMQSLGSKSSLFHQEKMPFSHRRGIVEKAASKEKTRRKEAQENGIILEKTKNISTSRDGRRQRGVDIPAVGKFRGGTLKLSKKDVMSIQGSGAGGHRGKKRRP